MKFQINICVVFVLILLVGLIDVAAQTKHKNSSKIIQRKTSSKTVLIRNQRLREYHRKQAELMRRRKDYCPLMRPNKMYPN